MVAEWLRRWVCDCVMAIMRVQILVGANFVTGLEVSSTLNSVLGIFVPCRGGGWLPPLTLAVAQAAWAICPHMAPVLGLVWRLANGR